MNIAFLIYDGFTALDAIGPYEVLSRLPKAEIQFVSKSVGKIVADTRSLILNANKEFGDCKAPEIIVIPGGLRGTLQAARDGEILEWVRNTHVSSQWTTSVCTGSLILGAAGLLKGKQATTHWYTREMLAQYGAEYVQERYVRSGKIITAAGVSAGIDMALYLVREIAGEKVAETIQLGIEYDPLPPLDSGSLPKASRTTVRLAEAGLKWQLIKERIKGYYK